MLNSVFLYHCTQAGLDLALVNAEKLERYPSIPDEASASSPRTCSGTAAPDPVAAFAAHFRERKPRGPRRSRRSRWTSGSPRYIVEGTRDGLIADLDLALDDAHAAARSSTAR